MFMENNLLNCHCEEQMRRSNPLQNIRLRNLSRTYEIASADLISLATTAEGHARNDNNG